MARFVDFGLGTGGRLEEVRTAHVDLAAGTVRFHGKFDKVRTVPMLAPESIAAARVQIETEGKLWTMNPQHFRDVLARAAKRLGIPISRLTRFVTPSRRDSSRRAATSTCSVNCSAIRPYRSLNATTPTSWTRIS